MLEAYPVDLVLLGYAMHGTADEIGAHKIKQNIPFIAVSATSLRMRSHQSGLRCHNGRRSGLGSNEIILYLALPKGRRVTRPGNRDC